MTEQERREAYEAFETARRQLIEAIDRDLEKHGADVRYDEAATVRLPSRPQSD